MKLTLVSWVWISSCYIDSVAENNKVSLLQKVGHHFRTGDIRIRQR